MKTITKNYYQRMKVEAEEAKLVGREKVAENIQKQLRKVATRDPYDNYKYSSDSFDKDVQESIWDIIIRTADFHGVTISSDKAQDLVDKLSDEVVGSIRRMAKITSPIGSYEEPIPGEEKEIVVIDVEEV